LSQLNVRHVTTYTYERPVAFGEHRILFRPRASFDQHLIVATLDVTPQPVDIRWIHDVFNNCIAIATFGDDKASELRFETHIALDHTPYESLDFSVDKSARTYPFAYDKEDFPDLEPYLRRHYPDPDGELERWARKFLGGGQRTVTNSLLLSMTYDIKERFRYVRRPTHGTQDPLTTLTSRSGTCRDFALLMMEGVRALGLAARFVTGYIYVPSRGHSATLGGGATHAWCQVYIPGSGWVEFDPTNGIIGNRDLIRIGVARQPRQAIPLSGTFAGKRGDYKGMTVQVNVTQGEMALVQDADVIVT
jgi:transglutaminase-like putative cysteine protease